ncbi:hypothetical protein TCAL_00832 [Tigriopus californicus]|uniref:Metallo-beta-lactamase domain-containing protein n=1 Tax=Tigriopus californicus TaxID=6832 RepID=A0A553NBN9_TIGCA|nr:acyl-coenzyme A thioesterase MBLAC2-like [Tigriopus californicus]TRY62838.1 hypothetical protein TCAL_00832 [Tigriopus californicus]
MLKHMSGTFKEKSRFSLAFRSTEKSSLLPFSSLVWPGFCTNPVSYIASHNTTIVQCHGRRRIYGRGSRAEINCLKRGIVTNRQHPPPPHPLFHCNEVRPGVFWIEEKYFDSWNRANVFFLVGSDRDLLTDTGVGIFNLREFLHAKGLRHRETMKPMDVVLTHIHFDHSGGVHHFQDEGKIHERVEIKIHELEAKHLSHPLKTASWVMNHEVWPKPSPQWNAQSYKVQGVANVSPLQDGKTIHLGDKTFQVLHVPGHSPGSIALFDENHGILLTGDTLYQTDQELIDWYPGSSCKRLEHSLFRLHELIPSVDLILPGHNAVLYKRDIMLQCIDRHLSRRSWSRTFAKTMISKPRAIALLGANHYVVALPEALREMLQT